MDKTVHSCELVFAYKEANWTKIKTNENFILSIGLICRG